NAMQEQDEDLVQIIRELQETKGRGEIFDPSRLSEKIEVLGPSIELMTLKSNICAEVINTIGVSWDEWYGRLTLYKNREGHCNVPHAHKESGFNLGYWVNTQRRDKESLSEDRRQRLDKLAFVWDARQARWEENFLHLKAYKEREGHCLVPHAHKENGFKLGSWVNVQRTNQNLSEERRQRLNKLGFVWDVLESAW